MKSPGDSVGYTACKDGIKYEWDGKEWKPYKRFLPDGTLAQLVEHSADNGKVTGPSPVRPTMANEAVIKFARQNLGISFYGDLDYYLQHNNNRGKIIQMLVDIVESQDRELTTLKAQQAKLVERALGLNDPPKPAPVTITTSDTPTVQTPAVVT